MSPASPGLSTAKDSTFRATRSRAYTSLERGHPPYADIVASSISTIAIFSEADRKGLHVLEADEAYCVGPPRAAESYLKIDEIVALRPERVIFNPGSESPRMERALERERIAHERACTLVLLRTGSF